ncbi:hypothetical protein HDU86_007050 [Geranomyces michiganensis]|nr:hypothetical protein HDU86_007050 [Geranomyces michiganensis]
MSANAPPPPKKYGLLLRGKNAQPSAATAPAAAPTRFAIGKKLAKPAAFANDDSDNDDHPNDEAITSFSSSSSSNLNQNHAAAASRAAEQKRVNVELRAVQAQRSKLAEEAHRKALEEDPNVFDYDAVYDGIKQAELEKKKSKDNPDGGVIKKPRYMDALIKASAQRKIDLERAELRKVQREREEEGEEFGDKEKFVTGAYKQQMADLKRVEEEEKRREAMDSDVTKGGNLTAFYRDILNQSDPMSVPKPGRGTANDKEEQHEGADERVSLPADNNDDERVKQAAIKQGLVQVNDSQEVVDKRQLLTGGLNLTSRTVVRQQQEREAREREAREKAEKKAAEERARAAERKNLREQQARAREMVMRQHAEKEEEKKRKAEAEQEELRRKMARQTTDETVSDARARYLARKQAQPRVEDDSDSE